MAKACCVQEAFGVILAQEARDEVAEAFRLLLTEAYASLWQPKKRCLAPPILLRQALTLPVTHLRPSTVGLQISLLQPACVTWHPRGSSSADVTLDLYLHNTESWDWLASAAAWKH